MTRPEVQADYKIGVPLANISYCPELAVSRAIDELAQCVVLYDERDKADDRLW